jgi:hypothetical protein
MATTIDKDLTNALKVARGGKPMQFAFLTKGAEGKLLVGKKVPPKEIADTKKAIGANAIFKGRCVGEDGTLVFYVAKEPPGTLLAQLKKRLKDDAGLTFPVEIRVKADAESEPVEEEAVVKVETSAASSPPASPNAGAAPAQATGDAPAAPGAAKAAVMKRLNALSPAIKDALKGPQAARVQQLFIAAGGLIKKEDYQQADKVLDQLEPLLGPSPAAPAAPPAPPAPPQMPAAAAASAERTAPPLDASEAEWMRRVTAVEPRVQDARKTRASEAKWMSLFMAAQDLASEGDFAQALKALDHIERLLDGAGAAGAGAAADKDDGKPVVVVWRDAKEAVDVQLEQLYGKLKMTGAPALERVAAKIEAVLTSYRVGLMTALTEYDQASGANKEAARAKALQVVKTYQANLPKDKRVIGADMNPFGVKVEIRQTLGAALTRLGTILGAV